MYAHDGSEVRHLQSVYSGADQRALGGNPADEDAQQTRPGHEPVDEDRRLLVRQKQGGDPEEVDGQSVYVRCRMLLVLPERP